jgi:hypothetical protein
MSNASPEVWAKENHSAFAIDSVIYASELAAKAISEGVELGLINLHRIKEGSTGRSSVALTTRGKASINKLQVMK